MGIIRLDPFQTILSCGFGYPYVIATVQMPTSPRLGIFVFSGTGEDAQTIMTDSAEISGVYGEYPGISDGRWAIATNGSNATKIDVLTGKIVLHRQISVPEKCWPYPTGAVQNGAPLYGSINTNRARVFESHVVFFGLHGFFALDPETLDVLFATEAVGGEDNPHFLYYQGTDNDKAAGTRTTGTRNRQISSYSLIDGTILGQSMDIHEPRFMFSRDVDGRLVTYTPYRPVLGGWYMNTMQLSVDGVLDPCDPPTINDDYSLKRFDAATTDRVGGCSNYGITVIPTAHVYRRSSRMEYGVEMDGGGTGIFSYGYRNEVSGATEIWYTVRVSGGVITGLARTLPGDTQVKMLPNGAIIGALGLVLAPDWVPWDGRSDTLPIIRDLPSVPVLDNFTIARLRTDVDTRVALGSTGPGSGRYIRIRRYDDLSVHDIGEPLEDLPFGTRPNPFAYVEEGGEL